MQEPYRVSDFKGLTPAIDPTRSNDQYVLKGQNYLFDAIGPKSAFGNRLLLPQPLQGLSQPQGIRLKLRTGAGVDRCFTLTNQAIMAWDEAAGGWQPVYVIPDTSAAPYRWTFGYLSGFMYFCHPRAGIIVYDVANDYAFPLAVDGMPESPLAIVVNNGFLVALTPENVQWSNPSDGQNWTPALGGAGFYKVAARIPGYPIMITSYTAGVLTWTTGGVLRSEFSADQEVFRHRALNTEYRPINSFCTYKSDDNTVVILDERGLFQSKGEAPTALTPLFNEFLIQYLQANNLRLGNNVRLEWDELQRHLYLSYSFSFESELYEQAFVLYPPVDKWGEFNESHYGILPLKITGGERDDDYYGFVDADGRVKTWQDVGSREVRGDHPVDNLYAPTIQIPYHNNDGDDGAVLSSSIRFNTFNSILTTQRAGYYADDGLTPVAPQLTDLNSWIWLGLFRSSQGVSYDELTELLQVMLRSNESGPTDRTSGVYDLLPPDNPVNNYTLLDSNYALEEINYVNSKLRIIGTNDGVTEFQSADASVAGFSRAARHYSCGVVGLWHILEVKANEVGEAFYLKTLELTGCSAGRLM